MFRTLPAAVFGANDSDNETNLKLLADSMSAGFDKPFDGVDAEESAIPALYTYLGQFIDHDITFDPESRRACRDEERRAARGWDPCPELRTEHSELSTHNTEPSCLSFAFSVLGSPKVQLCSG